MARVINHPGAIPTGDGAYRPHWTREQFSRAYELGLFAPDERLELIAGNIFQKMTMKPAHAAALARTYRALLTALGGSYEVRSQLPIVLSTDGEPEPDIAVVRNSTDDYVNAHPTQDDTLLVVEVSDATLRFDQGRKAAYYVESGIPEYWIVNLNQRQVEIYRNPHATAANDWGFDYDAPIVAHDGDNVTPLALPHVSLRATDMLPPVATSTI